MKLFITESKLNKIIQEELKALQEGRADLFDAAKKYGSQAERWLRDIIDGGGDAQGFVDDLEGAAKGGMNFSADPSASDRITKAGRKALEKKPAPAAAPTTALSRRAATDLSPREAGAIVSKSLGSTSEKEKWLQRQLADASGPLKDLTYDSAQKLRNQMMKDGATAAAILAATGLTAHSVYAAADGGGTSTIQPVPTPGGSPSLPTGGAATASGWDRYLRGSRYVTSDQAKQVHDAWKAYVASPAPMQEQAGGLDDSFQSFQRWWKAAMSKNLLGKHGSPEDTIKWLRSNTNVAPVDRTSGSSLKESTYNRWQKLIK